MNTTQVKARITELRDLKPGWMDGEGVPVDHKYLDFLERLLPDLIEMGLPAPYVFPSIDGNVVLEWRDEWAVSLDVEFDKDSMWFHAQRMDKEDYHDMLITKISNSESWIPIVNWFRSFNRHESE